MSNSYEKTDIEYWKKRIVPNCKKCSGSGIVSVDEKNKELVRCICVRSCKMFAKMFDPIYGLRQSYHDIKLKHLTNLTPTCRIRIEKYIKFLSSKDPFRNVVVTGEMGSGKSSVAAVIYKQLMSYEYEVSIVSFSEIVALSRLFMTNSQAFNERRDFYEFLKHEEFLIIEDVTNIGHKSAGDLYERLGYSLLDDLFSHRGGHRNRSSIITKGNFTLSPSTLGNSYFYQIYKSSTNDDKVIGVTIENVNQPDQDEIDNSEPIPDVDEVKEVAIEKVETKKKSPSKKRTKAAPKKVNKKQTPQSPTEGLDFDE